MYPPSSTHKFERGRAIGANFIVAGLSFLDCYHRCREAFLVNSDLTLRTQLTEFLDHMLLKIKKGNDGTENLIIPLDGGALRMFVEQREEDDT